jgi:CRP-like cAMP-binding protein
MQFDLGKFKIFKGLQKSQLETVSGITGWQKFDQNEIILHEGEQGDRMYLLLKGDVQVSKRLTLLAESGDMDERDKSLTVLSDKSAPVFGEVALLRPESSRIATVRALTECELGIIKRDDFLDLCEQEKEIGLVILKNINEILCLRLEKANQDILKLTTAFSLAVQG